ncbi:MAG: hypothetical protein PVJ67_02050 [Candidatus Pacearchaeota archaeon]|jgi:hypothetical protein
METKQINMKIPLNLLSAAESYAKNFGFRNIQELATESMREKIFEKNEFDENFSEREIDLIDNLISKTLKSKKFISEDELFGSLK